VPKNWLWNEVVLRDGYITGEFWVSKLQNNSSVQFSKSHCIAQLSKQSHCTLVAVKTKTLWVHAWNCYMWCPRCAYVLEDCSRYVAQWSSCHQMCCVWMEQHTICRLRV